MNKRPEVIRQIKAANKAYFRMMKKIKAEGVASWRQSQERLERERQEKAARRVCRGFARKAVSTEAQLAKLLKRIEKQKAQLEKIDSKLESIKH
jgi:DNA-binding FrmR family transcriptional regulator